MSDFVRKVLCISTRHMDQKDNEVLEPMSWEQAVQAHRSAGPYNGPVEVFNTFYGYLIKLPPLDLCEESQAGIWKDCAEAGFSAVLIDTLRRTQAAGYRYLNLDCDSDEHPEYKKGKWDV
jgi:hypothetical protein